ncbi:CHY zinc finger protein [Corynebacterium doosanense]|uniref:CHY-type domain-containing protein n=1 Tax=Corynebacterium doosanense CAU 212 = DSM 45436 TaxID=558173 RepID=A0A097ICU2_9CORY|nr:CHY zinc finger protein [Corynebacterium doosanense]AIT59956.1 hypothetical protein CDOO_00420 [Corynebacterium doosanense CAU 212 = DSM 45436]
MTRQGVDLDPQGRCAHYRSPRDIALNRCGTCGDYFACHRCHDELTDHVFGRVDKRDPEAVECGICGHRMGYNEYSTAPGCAGCGHEFNPGCAAHAHLYWA